MKDIAQILEFNLKAPSRLRCSCCGATTDAACDCGAGYLPAGKLAAAAILANPQKSDRAIAADLGIGSNTVRRARQSSTAPNGAVGKRAGRDGRARQLPRPSTKSQPTVVDPIKQTRDLLNWVARLERWQLNHADMSDECRARVVQALETALKRLQQLAKDARKAGAPS